MNHSMLEDTIVYAATGISAPLILLTRMSFALLLVWGRRLYHAKHIVLAKPE